MIRTTIKIGLILTMIIRCSQPEDSTDLIGRWTRSDSEVHLYGESIIDQPAIDPTQPIPNTLIFSGEQPIQLNYVNIHDENGVITIRLVEGYINSDCQLDLKDSLGVKSASLRIGDIFGGTNYKSSNVEYSYNRINAFLSIQSMTLLNISGDSLAISGSVEFPYLMLQQGEVSLIQQPDIRNYGTIRISELVFREDDSCSVVYWPSLESTVLSGTWSTSKNEIILALSDTTRIYEFEIQDDVLRIDENPYFYDQEYIGTIESSYGLQAGSLVSVFHVRSSYFGRIKD